MKFSPALEQDIIATLAADSDTHITFPESAYRHGTILVYRDNLTWRLPRYLDYVIGGELLPEGWYFLRSCKRKGCMNPFHHVPTRKPYFDRKRCPNGHTYNRYTLLPEGSRDRCRLCRDARNARRRRGGGYPRGKCRKGHDLTPENSYLSTDANGTTHRRCRRCHLERTRAARRTARMEN